ncbi:MAG: aminotransferase class I/II-fold pyridoxal phosphate-dependent enzyme [Spirochaetia bacterium]|nr:aminotransferase class I/II-fold pyridoxal phosphate-dependent enzyme [Spirochaetia bacterium]
MIYFESDYTEGAHPKILERLNETNMIQASGYGHDEFCESAKNKIRKTINCPNAQIQFITGGTQTNQIVIDTMLKPFEGVVSAQTGHVNSHEAGAIEYTGHKVIPIPQHEGKIDGTELNDYLETFFSDGNNEHMVFPGMVYISHPTEYGTLYTKNELTKISSVCRKNNIPLFMDGARLGYGIMAKSSDLSLEDIAELCDVFYIGGTKCGALCGEAVVFTKNNMPLHFENLVKKHGALLAKGRLLGVQFDALFTDNLYLEISKNAIDTAEVLKKALKEKGYRFLLDSPTNQQFVILENKFMEELKKSVKFNFWEKYDKDHTVVRFATSWSTKMENVEKLINLL